MVDVIIVGVDPGITTGLAIVDTRGNLIALMSKRNIRRNELIHHITKFGKPILIACDVFPPPKTVEKISSVLGCKLDYPEKSLSREEKLNLTKYFANMIKNDHELDALSAVIKTWKKYRNLFDKVEIILKNLGLMEIYDSVLLKLLKEDSSNIEDAIEKVLAQKRKIEIEPEKIKKLNLQEYQNLVEELRKRIKERDIKIQEQEEELNRLHLTIKKLKEEIEKLKSVKVDVENIYRIREKTEKLSKSIELWKKFRKIENKGYEPLIEIERIEGEKLEEIDQMIELNKRVVLCKDMKNLNLLNEYNIKAVIVENPVTDKELEKAEFPIIVFEPEMIKNFEYLKAVQKNVLEEKIKQARKVGFIKWLEAYKKRKL
ncbi:MAG: DUF460 domain-containing protein [Candidatus Aenigmatarchaeota archaeon]